MRKYMLLTAVLFMVASVSSQAFAQKKEKKTDTKQAAAPAMMFSNNNDSISYIIGADIAHSFAKNSIELNKDFVFKGFMDAQAKNDTLFNKEQINKIMAAWQQLMSSKKMAAAEQENAKNVHLGDAFLAENKKKEGVIETPSGLQYKIIKQGVGEMPHDSDMVSVHYTGTLIDGTKFDSSRDRGEPIEFPVNGVIPGWTEALKLMKPGAQFMLYIPSRLAYGDKATGPIPAGSTLIFDVELLEFEKKK